MMLIKVFNELTKNDKTNNTPHDNNKDQKKQSIVNKSIISNYWLYRSGYPSVSGCRYGESVTYCINDARLVG